MSTGHVSECFCADLIQFYIAAIVWFQFCIFSSG